jgi:hypothetical protein
MYFLTNQFDYITYLTNTFNQMGHFMPSTYLPPTSLPTHLPKCTTYLLIHPPKTYLHINKLSTYPSTHLPKYTTYLTTYPPTYNLPTYLPTHPPMPLTYLPIHPPPTYLLGPTHLSFTT